MAAREAGFVGAAALRTSLYNTFFRRTSVYVIVCLGAAYGSTELYLRGTDHLWKTMNKGVGREASTYGIGDPLIALRQLCYRRTVQLIRALGIGNNSCHQIQRRLTFVVVLWFCHAHRKISTSNHCP